MLGQRKTKTKTKMKSKNGESAEEDRDDGHEDGAGSSAAVKQGSDGTRTIPKRRARSSYLDEVLAENEVRRRGKRRKQREKGGEKL